MKIAPNQLARANRLALEVLRADYLALNAEGSFAELRWEMEVEGRYDWLQCHVDRLGGWDLAQRVETAAYRGDLRTVIREVYDDAFLATVDAHNDTAGEVDRG